VHGAAAAGDAERLPFREDSFDAAFIECVLSTLPQKQAALLEIRRVLRPGGAIALSDVVVERPLPAPLDSFVGWIACTAGAETAKGYLGLLERSGFPVILEEDHDPAMGRLISQARRRLALLQGALGAGIVPADPALPDRSLVELGQELLSSAAASVEAGALGYALFVGRKV
jgi:SAM-dependent methyltransferase